MKEVMWTLATKHFKPSDWKRLAMYWKFTPDHIRCIEHQYTGKDFRKIGFIYQPDPNIGMHAGRHIGIFSNSDVMVEKHPFTI
jgi:hypothetical protein